VAMFGYFQTVKYSTDSNVKNGKDFSLVSIKFYKNADTLKLQILAENKGKSGIYL
jgi:hypothetical protein